MFQKPFPEVYFIVVSYSHAYLRGINLKWLVHLAKVKGSLADLAIKISFEGKEGLYLGIREYSYVD